MVMKGISDILDEDALRKISGDLDFGRLGLGDLIKYASSLEFGMSQLGELSESDAEVLLLWGVIEKELKKTYSEINKREQVFMKLFQKLLVDTSSLRGSD